MSLQTAVRLLALLPPSYAAYQKQLYADLRTKAMLTRSKR